MPIPSLPSMIPQESPVECISPLSPFTQSQSHRAMIHKLLERYTKEEIHRLIEEESSSISTGHLFASKMHTQGQCPEHSINSTGYLKPPEYAFFGSYAGHESDNASAVMPSLHHVNALAPSLFHAGSQKQSDTVFFPSTHRLRFTCGICAEESIVLTCTRRNDLGRHIEKFHNSNAVWFCQHPGCKVAYDWQAAYQNHLRNAHGRSQMNMDEAVVKLCPQMVFACGFENCSGIFEATSEFETAGTFKEYSQHIIKHFGEGSTCERWTYSTRIRNLLRQSQVRTTWDKSWPESERSRLRWDSQSSMVLRKLLETKHLDYLPLLIEISIMLGSNNAEACRFASKLELPVKTKCPYEYKAYPNVRRLSPQTNGGQENYHFNLSRGISLDYRFPETIRPGARVPRSIQSTNYGQGRYNDPETIQLLASPNYFIIASINRPTI